MPHFFQPDEEFKVIVDFVSIDIQVDSYISSIFSERSY